jgi:hypothetical protein
MKMDKRTSKYIMAATVLIAIVVTAPPSSSANVAAAQQPNATAPVLSNASVAAAQEPPKLTIENFVNAINHCPFTAEHCPQGKNTGMLTTIAIASAPRSGLPPTIIKFPAGDWGKQTVEEHGIPNGRTYEITTTVPIPEYSWKIDIGDMTIRHHFTHVNTSIEGLKDGCTAAPDKAAHCESTMGDGGATIKVTYNWSHD